jgi:hypothetical protein
MTCAVLCYAARVDPVPVGEWIDYQSPASAKKNQIAVPCAVFGPFQSREAAQEWMDTPGRLREGVTGEVLPLYLPLLQDENAFALAARPPAVKL